MIQGVSSGKVILDKDGVVGTMISESNGCQYVHLSIQHGSLIAAHSLPHPVTFYVLSGAGLLFLKDREYEVGEGDLVEVEAGASRGWANRGDATLFLLVIKHTG